MCFGARRRHELFRVWVVLQGKKGLSGEQMEEEVAVTKEFTHSGKCVPVLMWLKFLLFLLLQHNLRS